MVPFESILARRRRRRFSWVLRGLVKVVVSCLVLWFLLIVHGLPTPATNGLESFVNGVMFVNVIAAVIFGPYLLVIGLSNILRGVLGNETFGWD